MSSELCDALEADLGPAAVQRFILPKKRAARKPSKTHRKIRKAREALVSHLTLLINPPVLVVAPRAHSRTLSNASHCLIDPYHDDDIHHILAHFFDIRCISEYLLIEYCDVAWLSAGKSNSPCSFVVHLRCPGRAWDWDRAL